MRPFDPIPGYAVVRSGAEGGISGGVGPAYDGGPGHATFYVEVADIEEALGKVEGLGGRRVIGPIDAGSLSFALFADPEGHLVGLFKRPRTTDPMRRLRRRANVSTEEPFTDGLWAIVEPLLPPKPSGLKAGRPRVPDRTAFEGIIYVLRNGIPWRMLPKDFGCSGVTCWRRLRGRQKADVFGKLHRTLLDRLGSRPRREAL